VTVFSDFRCSYCRALSTVLRAMNVRVIERPISSLGSRDLSDRVYCAKNREEALHAAYAGEPIKAGPACDTSGLDANEAFARKHGLNGTPVIVRSDGAVLEGYRPRPFLEKWLKEGRS
jgi:thiol:disulfide interchange protein DsbC